MRPGDACAVGREIRSQDRHWIWLGGLLLLIAVGLTLSCTRRHRAAPNVLLVTLDTTRADHLGCYGNSDAHTPTLDSLAACGMRFTQVITPVPLTAPAHTSLLTGLNPPRHGVRDNGAYVLEAGCPLVQERFRQAGYETAAFVSAFVLERQFGLARGFDLYDDRFRAERIGLRTARAVARWLEGRSTTRPLFLWVHFFDPHTPWNAPEPYRSLDLPSPYAKEIAAMDGALGLLLREMRWRGLLENTIVVAAGDHGEGLGDHGENEHGVFLYDETLRVPLIVCRPGVKRGAVCDGQASLIDLGPTLLDLAALDPLPDAEGTSLGPLLHGKGRALRPAEYSETYYPENAFGHSALHSLRTTRWKWVHAPRPELYDLTADPRETRDLHAELPDTARRFNELLTRYLEAQSATRGQGANLSAEDEERLRSLGYLSGSVTPETSAEDLPDPKDLLPYLATFTRAKQALVDGDWAQAERDLREVLRGNPENIIAARQLGQVLEKQRKYDEAVTVLEAAARLAPKDPTLARHLGVAYSKAGLSDKALEAFRVVAGDPRQHWMGVIGMARALLDQGRPSDAMELLEGAATGRPDGTEARQMAAAIGRYLEVKRRQAPGPAGESSRLDLAGAAFDLQLFEEARRVLQFRSADAHTEGIRHRILGGLAGELGDHAAALREFEQARAALPDDAYVHRSLAPLYLEAGRTRDALEAARKATQLGQPLAADYYNLACAYALLGDKDAALTALEKAVQLGYRNADKLLEDPDLAPLQDDPRLARLAASAVRNP